MDTPVKWFQVFLSNTNNSIYNQSFVYTVKWFRVLLYSSPNRTSVIWLIWFYDISTTIGYSMPNSIHTYIKYI